jgi:hypothetical protein
MTGPRFIFSDLCRFTEKQWAATETADNNKYTLFGGSRGPGKSFWLRWWLLRFLLKAYANGYPRMRVMLACEDYPSLKDRQITKIVTEFPPFVGSVKSTQDDGLGFHLAPRFGGGIIALRNLDDPSKYMSSEYAAIAVDELTKNPLDTFDKLRGSLRWPRFPDTRFVAATNPAPGWVRDYWISRQFPEQMQGIADQFAFVPALPTDNPNLDPSYWQMLETLPGALRAAWLLGDWFAAVDGLVYETFTADNLTDDEPDPERPIELAIDDGYIDPRATLFIQRQPGGDVLVFAELYQTKTLEERTVEDILALCERNGWPRPELAAVSHEAPALRERLRRADIPARNWLAAKNLVSGERSKRVAAIKRTRGLICDGQGHRAIKVNRRCKSLIDEIMAGYKYPEGKKSSVDDLPEDGNDHAANALESWCFLRMGRG